MPKSLATDRDPFRGVSPKPTPTLKVPQARVLAALMPADPEGMPPIEWPMFNREMLGVAAGYTAISGTITRALNGIRPGNKTSGDPHPGLLDLGLVETEKLDVCDGMETNYRITRAGIAAYRAWLAAGNALPPVRDALICTNTERGYKMGQNEQGERKRYETP